MMQILGTLLGGVAVLAVTFELPKPAIVLGAAAYWMLSHGAQCPTRTEK